MSKIKLNKNIAIMVSSVALIQGMIYAGFVKIKGAKPFVKNEYSHHLVELNEYENNVTSEFYTDKDIDMDEAVIVKTPYNIDSNKNVKCEVIAINPDKFSNKELNYIKHNFNNQKIVLTDNDITSKLMNLYDENNTLLTYDQINTIPNENNYQISYSFINEDYSKTKLMNNEAKDLENTIEYIICSSLGLCSTIPATLKLTKKIKKY